jgi:hypothetical protein
MHLRFSINYLPSESQLPYTCIGRCCPAAPLTEGQSVNMICRLGFESTSLIIESKVNVLGDYFCELELE